jgi:DNA topoisomerase-1
MDHMTEDIVVDRKLLRSISTDVFRNAEAAGLVYVSSNDPGYIRKKRRGKFVYLDGDEILNDPDELDRIKRLVLPPAWENVWICKIPNGHLQATGFDKRGRKQYRYHAFWAAIRNQTKFYRLREFGEKLPLIRAAIDRDLSVPGFPCNKVLATMISLMERVSIRIGNAAYEKLYGSFGLTTLKNHHVQVNGTKLKLMFRGKKGVNHNITLKSRRLSRIIKGCQELPGKELFSYYDDEGNIQKIDSGMVNEYIKYISGGDFSAKDFRTWAGSIHALLAFREVGGFETKTEMNKKIPAALDQVAKQLGNTRAVCKKYYVHPIIIELYSKRKLDKYLRELEDTEIGKDEDSYTAEERILLKILRSRPS